MKLSSGCKQNNSLAKSLFALILSSSILIAGCSGNDQAKSDNAKSKETAEQNEKDKKPAVPVEVASVIRGDIQQTYRTITTLEAEKDVQVVARSTGLLNELLVEEGDLVEKGQLLAQLDVEQLELEVAQLSATTKKLHKELERQESLFKRKLASSDALDRAKFEYQSQLAQYKLSKLRLDYASIKAPISGIVTERMVKQGNLIRDNDILFKIVDLSSLKAVLHLPEKELAKVKKHQAIILSVDALGDRVMTGEIERIRPMIDTETGTFRVIAKINNQDSFLKSGMFGRVEVVFDTREDSLLIEQQAVITQDNRSHVFVVKDNKAIQTPIETGFQQSGMVEVISGLSHQDQVITTGQQIIKHESVVEIVGAEPLVADKNDESNKSKPKTQAPNANSAVAVNP